LVANKMESNGKEGMIHVSETTKRILEKAFPREYRFEKNTDVHIPSLDKTYEGYFVFYEENIATIEDIPL
jgi:Adenylate and Guanylate cyclase catalytic domain.